MKCPQCQYENPGSHNFCGECGMPLTHANGGLKAPSYEDLRLENARLFKELEARNSALTEALEQQTATSEILRVISRSPTDVQPVVATIAERAVKLCDAELGVVSTIAGEHLHLAAMFGLTDERAEATRRAFPMPLDAESASAGRSGAVPSPIS